MATRETEIAEVRRQIGEGQGHLEKQEAMIARLEGSGDDSSEARTVLSRLNEAQQLYVDQLKRLEAQPGKPNIESK